MRILSIGMSRSGNLGDDIIASAITRHLHSRWPDAEIGVLGGLFSNPFPEPSGASIRHLTSPRKRGIDAYFGRRARLHSFLEQTDLVTIGGGGLFQDSHGPFTIHNWVKHVFRSDTIDIPTWLVSLGVGPLDLEVSRWYLRQLLPRFNVVQVRDRSSAHLVERLGRKCQTSCDVVWGSEINWLGFERRRRDPAVGCSLRKWPGFSTAKASRLLQDVCARTGYQTVRLFVFGFAKPYKRQNLEFAQTVADRLRRNGIRTKIYTYRKTPIDAFTDAFSNVSCAVATRYHANILWQKLDTPTIPLSYAPKVRALYVERGANVLDIADPTIDGLKSPFQEIPATDEYQLPQPMSGDDTTGYRVGRHLVPAISTIELVASTAQSVHVRLRRVLQMVSDSSDQINDCPG